MYSGEVNDKVGFSIKSKVRSMKRPHYILFIFLAATAGWLSSCLEAVSYPDEPHIYFKSLDINAAGDGSELVIGFTDGDGDIGLDQGDTSGIFCPDTCRYHHNLFCDYYELRDGEWVEVEPTNPVGEPVKFYYRVPPIRPSGQNPALRGEIRVDMAPAYLISAWDTFRFEIQLVDRALNHSNVVTTPEFVKN